MCFSFTQLRVNCFPILKTDGRDIFGYFDPTFENVKALFALRQSAGSWDSGEWYVGGCIDEFQIAKLNIKSSENVVNVFFREVKNIGCFLYMEENQQSMLLTRKLGLVLSVLNLTQN